MKDKLKTVRFILKSGNEFKVKIKGNIKITKSVVTGEIINCSFDKTENFFEVNLSDVSAIVEELEENL